MMKKILVPTVCSSLFVEFVDALTIEKEQWVRKSLRKPSYWLKEDYYKPFRDGIIQVHQGKDHDVLDEYRRGKPTPAKDFHFGSLKGTHTQFTSEHDIEYIGFIRNRSWECKDLRVSVTPHLGLRIDGKPYMVRLWLKPSHPSPLYTSTVLFLLRWTCVSVFESATPAIWDVPRGELLATVQVGNVGVMLADEAAKFRTLREKLAGAFAPVEAASGAKTNGQVDLFEDRL